MQTDLLIIGAGPFGLSLAAYAKSLGVDFLVAGRAMEFWKKNMPEGMYLRSASDWSLDPTDRFSIMNYLEALGKTTKDVEPLSLEFYLQYAQWFQDGAGIETISEYVTRLDQKENGFLATFEDGKVVEAKNVAVAIPEHFIPAFKPAKEFVQEIKSSPNIKEAPEVKDDSDE